MMTKTKAIAMVLVMAMVLTGCASKQGAGKSHSGRHGTEQTAVAPSWHTCLIQNAEASLYIGEDTYRTRCSMQTVRDSLIILSVTPMLGIELYRIEATPTEIVAVDKMQRRYLCVSYEDINRYVVPQVRYSDLQELASGEITAPNASVGRVEYKMGKKTIGLSIQYPVRQLDTAVNMKQTDRSRYEGWTLTQWMNGQR